MRTHETLIHEGVFVGFLAAAMMLLRESSGMGEEALWFLLAAVVVNAILLRTRRWSPAFASSISITANSLLIAWIVEATGGGSSLFWPLFLLPLYTTGLAHPAITLAVAALHAAMLASFHLDASMLEFAIKAGFLLVSAWTIARGANRERAAIGDADQKRATVEQMAKRLVTKRLEAERETRSLHQSLALDADRITVILATAQLIHDSIRKDDPIRLDAERILGTAKTAAQSIRGLLVRELAKPQHAARSIRT